MFPPILILPQVVAIADRAGAAILHHYEQGTAATAKSVIDINNRPLGA